MYCSTPVYHALHYLPEFAQSHVHWVGDAIQASHPLSLPSPPALNLSQHHSLFQWVSSLHQVAKVLDFSISPSNEYPGFIFFSIDWFDLFAVQGTQESSLAPQFSTQPSLWSNSHIHIWLLEKIIAFTRWTFVGQVMSLFLFHCLGLS